MRTAARLTGYGLTLALAFGAAWGAGVLTGPPAFRLLLPLPAPTAAPAPAGDPPASSDQHGGDQHGSDQRHGGDQAGGDQRGSDQHGGDQHGDRSAGAPGTDGLAGTAAGYTLLVPTSTVPVGRPAEFAFAVTGSDGRPVLAYDVHSEQLMHAVVVRRDGVGFQHLHPTLGPDGLWRVPLAVPAAGVYRLFADFTPTGGPPLVLGADLFAPGPFTPQPFTPSRVAQVDGYQARLDGDLVAGRPSQVFATVSRDGAAVTDLQPYLGAFGHLVALREGDLAYVHLHPDAAAPAPTDRSGPGIAFTAEVPTPGRYRLFLDFRHADVVRTAAWAVDTRDGT